ncbi:hypothetical protein [Microbacterium tenebrionis]|uniref:hypothetical protein n=1 Tax=Microbacterium tenebrionis TaxID=2830665 RepID=UPI001589B534|nr:hypothetical protein [Microbacterium ihumii]
MDQNSLGVQLSYASVDRGDGSDPRAAATEVLRSVRALAAVRDATIAWGDADEAVLLIPVTDDDQVLTLTDEDTIATELTIGSLRDAFADAGLNLWIDGGESVDFDEFEAEFTADEESAVEHVDEDLPDEDEDDLDPELFEPQPVDVAAFSHRGPVAARFLAEVNGTDVVHAESGTWSLQRFRTTEPTGAWPSSAAELPLIELNRTGDGGSWIEVTARANETVPFWTDAERDTLPVLDIASIAVPETAEVYRRLLAEGDGTRDELEVLGARGVVDVDAAHRALVAESLGGVVGSEARLRAFLAAFRIPAGLIDSALSAQIPVGQRFAPSGWIAAIGESFLSGIGESTPLTRRETPWARVVRFVRARPAVGLAVGAAELVSGAVLARRRGVGRVAGILLIVDAVADLVIWAMRLSRR